MQFLLTSIVSGFLQKTVSSTKDGEDFLRLFTAYNSFEVLSQQCSTEDEPQIKICLYCVSILMRVTQEVTKRLSNSGTEILYKQLYRKMEEVHEMRPKFLHAATCLSKVCHIMRIFHSLLQSNSPCHFDLAFFLNLNNTPAIKICVIVDSRIFVLPFENFVFGLFLVFVFHTKSSTINNHPNNHVLNRKIILQKVRKTFLNVFFHLFVFSSFF